MAKSKDSDTKDIKKQRIKLGKYLRKCRGEKSLRSIALAVGLSPSNLMYIEEGITAPRPEIYIELIKKLEPEGKIKKDIERAYMLIREAPPPDVYEIIKKNEGLNDSLRIIEGHTLTAEHLKELNTLLNSFIVQ